MKTDKQKKNWLVDATLFAGFLLAMFLDLTGLSVHQWLGVAVAAWAGYHLLAHGQWVVSVTQRFFGRASNQARRFYLVDAGLLIGFAAIGATGLAISAWLNLALTDYAAWRTIHVLASVITLGLVVVKIGMHWRWIVNVAGRRLVLQPARANTVLAAQPVRVGRREFVRLMSFVGVTALFAGANALREGDASLSDASAALAQTVAAANEDTSAPAVVAQAASAAIKSGSASAATTNTTSACVVRCNKRCTYPGRCRRYVDTNGNKRCDLGECGV